MNPFAEWQNFYVVVGSAAGALTGLQFVAMALIAEISMGPEETGAGEAFSTPTIVHFGTVLMLSAVLEIPWRGVNGVAGVCGLTGLLGIVYTLRIARKVRAQQGYQPVMEDWIFRIVLPLCAYLLLAVAASMFRPVIDAAVFVLAAAALLLLFIGIHNSWDNVTYLVLIKKQRDS